MNEDNGFSNFKNEHIDIFQVTETIDIKVQYEKFKKELQEALTQFQEIKK